MGPEVRGERQRQGHSESCLGFILTAAGSRQKPLQNRMDRREQGLRERSAVRERRGTMSCRDKKVVKLRTEEAVSAPTKTTVHRKGPQHRGSQHAIRKVCL